MKKYTQSFLIILTLIIISTHLYSMENNIALTKDPIEISMEKDMLLTDPLIEECKNKYKKALENIVRKSQPSNTVYVPLWNAHSIYSTPTRKSPLIISAFHLTNCLATALHVVYTNGDQYAGITHYPKMDFSKHKDAIKMLCANAITKQHETKYITAINFFIIEPGKYNEDGNLTTDNNNCIFPCHPLEHYTKKEFEKIKPVTVTYFPYDRSENVLIPKTLQIILYPRKGSIMVGEKGITLYKAQENIKNAIPIEI